MCILVSNSKKQKMKTIFTSTLFIVLTGIVFSQKCIQQYVGTYKIDLDETISTIKETDPEKAKEAPPENFIRMMEETTMEIKATRLELNMMGRINGIDIHPKASVKEGGSCDLHLVVPEGQLPEGVMAPFLTIYEGKNKTIALKSTGGSNDMDNYIWTKIE